MMRSVSTLLLTLALGLPAGAQSFALRVGHEEQQLNNCGPVTAKVVLGFWGKAVTQARAAEALKDGPDDAHVSTAELAEYLRSFGLRTLHRRGGTPELVRRLVRAGFPVVVQQQLKSGDHTGHFRTVYGVDDRALYSSDSLLGAGLKHDDAAFEKLWQPYNGEYLVAYPPDREGELRALLGPVWDEQAHWRGIERERAAQVEKDPEDLYAWWGLGQARLKLGQPEAAAAAFSKAAALGLPNAHYWYQQEPFEAWNQTGQYELTERVARRVLEAWPSSKEARRYLALAQQGRAAQDKNRTPNAGGAGN
ncbi:hypothetical protein HNR42_001582 [Deinobacterium chartae]|uniref:Peptidase C39-like domain-containing protein n=1 Tax=Deinobacterium chartae TaxID=521158 RepID=A0A841HXM7_9DEIO|nr:C39 family peptidase [Deinobacterium chartae]MBB6098157.1 hypothetical protein [Deinobacterium chartae]